MKTFLLIIVLIVLAISVYFFIQGSKSKAGDAPGLAGEQLSQCGSKPNCVCSEHKQPDEHFIAPLAFEEGNPITLQAISQAIQAAGGRVVQTTDNYMAATFTSGIFGFVDDFEVRLDTEQGVVHMRSASRVGYSDLGANRKRVEQIKSALK